MVRKVLKLLGVCLIGFFVAGLRIVACDIEMAHRVSQGSREIQILDLQEWFKSEVDRARAQGYSLESILLGEVSVRKPALMNYLLELGANPRARNQATGRTLLQELAKTGSSLGVQLLLAKTKSRDIAEYVNEVDSKDELVALHYAVLTACEVHRWGGAVDVFVEIVRLLIAVGGLIELPDRVGKTALHMAATGGCFPVVEALIKLGADTKKRTTNGKTAYRLAQDYGHEAVLKLLTEQERAGQAEDFLLDEEHGEWVGQ